MLLCLPALAAPFFSDDWMQARKLAPDFYGEPFPLGGTGLSELFVFATGEPADTLAAQEAGYLAWWTAPDVKLAFWRPLSALTHALDHSLWPGSSALMHVHSLLWQVGVLVVLAVVFRRLLGPRAAVLALALYAWDEARGMVVGFLANRNALLAALFGLGVLWLHDRWRRDGWRPGAVLAPLLLVVGLLSAELALATTAYLFAYALFLDRGSLALRLARLVPYGVVVVAWKLVYRALGYGAAGSGVYVHPLSEPGLFLARLVDRAPRLALGQLTPIPSDLGVILPQAVSWGLAGLGLGAVCLLVGLAWPLLRARPEARFLALGSVLSLVPVSATFTSDRNLTFVGIGACGLVAMVLLAGVDASPARRWRRAALSLLVGFHLVLAPLCLPLRTLSTLWVDLSLSNFFAQVSATPGVEERTLVVPFAASDGLMGFGLVGLVARDRPAPRRSLHLVSSVDSVTVTRLDDRTLRLRAERFLQHSGQQMLRGPTRPFAVGDETVLSELTVVVAEVTDDGWPLEIEARFPASLEDPRWLWMTEEPGQLVPWVPPAVGEQTVVRGMLWGR